MKRVSWILFLMASCGGGSGFSQPFSIYWSVASQDLDGDGRPDLVYTSSYVNGPPPHPGYLSVALQDPATPCSFLAPIVYPTGSDPTSVVVADVDGDGRPDIVVGNSAGHSVMIYLQDPATPGHFKSPISLASGSTVNGVAAGDLDGNGACDIVVADGAGITIFLQGAGGTFGTPTSSSTGDSCTGIAIGDLNGDGLPDLAVTTSAQLLVFPQDALSPGTFLSPVAYTAGLQPAAVVIADLDQDGKPDLAVANLGPANGKSRGTLSILLQSPSNPGVFLSATNYTAGFDAKSLAVGDLNGDGKPDLVVGVNESAAPHPIVLMFFQDPASAGSFQAPSGFHLAEAAWAWGVAVVDVDVDGATDVLLTGNHGVYLLRQTPATPGQFQSPILLAK